MYAKDLSEPKYEYLIKNCENAGIKHVNDTKAFTECSITMDDVYDNKIQELQELFIRCRKKNISLALITQSYFSVPKDVRLNSKHYIIMKINNRNELQNIAISHSADTDYKDVMKIYRKCLKEPYSFLTIDTTLPSNNSLRFRENLFDML